MNKIYRIVFNQATQTWTAVAENARAKGKSGRTTVGSSKLGKLMSASVIGAALLSAQVNVNATTGDRYVRGFSYQCVYDGIDIPGANEGNNATQSVICGNGDTKVEKGTYRAVALGEGAQVLKGADGAVVIGNKASAADDSVSSVAIGESASVAEKQTIAIGNNAHAAGGDRAIAIGAGSTSQGEKSIVIGSDSVAGTLTPRSLVLGNDSVVYTSGENFSIGNDNSVYDGDNPVEHAYILGSNVKKVTSNSVFLGQASAYVEKGDTTGGIGEVTGFAGARPVGVVSVGAAGSERRIQNVAAGQISATSTDAINGSQLYAVAASANRTNYFHVNTDDKDQAAGNADTNEGSVDAKGGATGLYSLAAGMSAKANGQMATAIGTGANAADSSAIAIGEYAGTEGVANRTIMIGSYAGAKSSTTNGVLVGSHSAYNRTGSGGLIAIGNGAGSYEMSTTENPGFPEGLGYTTAIGNIAAVNATGLYNNYIGGQAGYYRHGDQNVSMGYLAGAAQASYSAVDITGIRTGAMGHDNVFFGTYSGLGLNGNDNIAIGQMSNTAWKFDDKNKTGSMNDESIKVAYADDTIAIGQETTAQKNTAIAIGKGAKAAIAEGDVALGAGSVTRAVTPTSSATINNVTYGTFAGATPTSAVSVGDVDKERQIQNVAAGRISADSTDAINGSQLYAVADKLTAIDAAANRTNYFHVNTGNANQADGNAATNEGTVDAKGGATATGAIAAGVNATATAGNAIAIGQGANSAHANSVVIGAGAKSSSLMGFSQATAVGFQANAGNDSVAIGSQAVATGATTTTTHSGWATAVGRAAQATGLGSVAMGNEANASHIGTVAVGPRAAASAREAAAFGGTSTASGYASLAAGYRSNASGALSSAYGSQSTATGTFSTANGYSADATGARSTSIGSESQATANFATALGDSAWATAASSTALGTGARSTGAASLAVGSAAQTQAFQSAAFGNGASVYAGGTQALALGANAATNDANAVALGSGARTAAAVATTEATINGITYDGFAGTAPIATVSVGNDTQKRTITNVAAGQISATSTDAINGSQLYAVADKLTADIKAADTNTITTVTAGKNITVKNIGTADAPNYQVATADQVVFDSVSITNGPTINNNGINMNGNRITNVAAGVADTDAVNLGQLKQEVSNINQTIVAAKTEVVAGENVSVDATPGANGQAIYTVNAKDTSASVSAGSSAVSVTKGATGKVGTTDVTDYAVDLSQNTKDDIQKGVDANTAVNNKGLTFAGDSGSTDVQKLGSTVGVKGDGNIITSASGSQINASLNKNLDLSNDGSITTGNTVVNNNGISITNDSSQTVSLTNNGLNNGGNRITNVARGINGTDAVNVDQLNDATSGIYGRIDNLDKDYRAGVAGNAAMVNIPQVTRPGANLLGIGLGHHKGESAVAVGFSSSSDNEQLIFKMSGSANTQGDFTIGSGLGWQW